MNPTLQHWQKFPVVDSEPIEMLRSMLGLEEHEELPAALWVTLGIHKAMECRFGSHPWNWRDLASMVIEAQAILPFMQNKTRWIPGSRIHIKTMNTEARYWHPGPLSLHLVNSFGNVYLVRADDIDAPEEAITDSEFNVNLHEAQTKAKTLDTFNAGMQQAMSLGFTAEEAALLAPPIGSKPALQPA